MSAKAAPFWIWLPGQAQPVQAGSLQAEPDAGRLTYWPDYLAHAQAVAPDPVSLRLSRRGKGLVLTSADGPPDGVGALEVCHDIDRKLA